MKKFHKYYMSAPNLNTFDDRIAKSIPGLPPNATIESVNYDCHTTVKDELIQTSASVLIIYSTPLDEE